MLLRGKWLLVSFFFFFNLNIVQGNIQYSSWQLKAEHISKGQIINKGNTGLSKQAEIWILF